MSRTKLFSGFGHSAQTRKFWKSGTAIEVFKFAVCLLAPVGASVIYANPTVMQELIMRMNLVSYPSSGPAPPSAHEVEQLMAQKAAGK